MEESKAQNVFPWYPKLHSIPRYTGGHLEVDNASYKQAGLLQIYHTVTAINTILFI